MSTEWALKPNRPQSPHLLFRAMYTLRSNHSALHKVAQVCRRGRRQLKRKGEGKGSQLKEGKPHTLPRSDDEGAQVHRAKQDSEMKSVRERGLMWEPPVFEIFH